MAYPIVNHDGMLEVLGVTRDISEQRSRRHQLEMEGRLLSDQIDQLDRQRSLAEMAAPVSVSSWVSALAIRFLMARS